MVCCLPLCRALARKHPDKTIVLVTRSEYIALARMSPDLLHVLNFPSAGVEMKSVYGWYVSDVVNPTAVEDALPPRPFSDYRIHLVDAFLTNAGLEPNREPYTLRPPAELRREIEQRLGLAQASGRKILIHTGRTWPIREWPEAYWKKLIDALHARYDVTIYHLCSPNRSRGEPMPVFDLPGTILVPDPLSPEMTAALIGSVDLMIGLDSGPIHLAGAIGIPQIGIFGPTLPELRMQLNERSRGVHRDLPCIGCHHRPPIIHWYNGCPHDIACMKQLDPSTVFQAVKDVLAKLSPTSSLNK